MGAGPDRPPPAVISTEKRPVGEADEKTKRRARRFLGVLQGTLQAAEKQVKESDTATRQSKVMARVSRNVDKRAGRARGGRGGGIAGTAPGRPNDNRDGRPARGGADHARTTADRDSRRRNGGGVRVIAPVIRTLEEREKAEDARRGDDDSKVLPGDGAKSGDGGDDALVEKADRKVDTGEVDKRPGDEVPRERGGGSRGGSESKREEDGRRDHRDHRESKDDHRRRGRSHSRSPRRDRSRDNRRKGGDVAQKGGSLTDILKMAAGSTVDALEAATRRRSGSRSRGSRRRAPRSRSRSRARSRRRSRSRTRSRSRGKRSRSPRRSASPARKKEVEDKPKWEPRSPSWFGGETEAVDFDAADGEGMRLLTTTQPPIEWLPKYHNPATRALLGGGGGAGDGGGEGGDGGDGGTGDEDGDEAIPRKTLAAGADTAGDEGN